jgi:hypothetical protein
MTYFSRNGVHYALAASWPWAGILLSHLGRADRSARREPSIFIQRRHVESGGTKPTSALSSEP